ncbi:WD40 repeat domain-containing protein [Aquisalimonas asiatica]|uniref:Uncharacterized protein n=1 Tax=Aquisalimonas asiatica TaxID=406100 RepID=A0A1H8TC10_9GAMM|nr:WD40 repeat domain-containing protein [Aquisalimonas asiatica]SEO88023.1 hypothetical protein SAMN04488052_10414 [Aquisalimonas asiatica]
MGITKRLLQLVVIAMITAGLGGCATVSPGRAMVVSVSEDGRYVVSSHEDRRLILWDVESQSRRVISRRANIYSAYFIEGQDAFLWQDLNDIVHVQAVDGEVLNRFEHVPVYGHAMASDLQAYFSSDAEFRIYRGWGKNQQLVKIDDDRPAFLGTLQNIILHEPTGTLLTAGHGSSWDSYPIDRFHPRKREGHDGAAYDGVVLWDMETRDPLHKMAGLSSRVHGDISPDGRYVVAAGETGTTRVWRTEDGEERWRLASYNFGMLREDPDTGETEWDDSNLIDTPDIPSPFYGDETIDGRNVAVTFIDDEHFIRIPRRHAYAALYHIDSPWHIAFLDLGDDPPHAKDRYIPSVDASWQANTLVTGQKWPHGGINVYRFDPETKELERVWSPRG